MSDVKKPMVVWAEDTDVSDVLAGEVYARVYASPTHPMLASAVRRLHEHGVGPGKPLGFLLLPIEDGALRVGDHLFRRNHVAYEYRHDSYPEGKWRPADVTYLAEVLMDAVEGVEP